MKKLLLLGTIFVATGALAFGGIGLGPWQRHKNQGVDAIGIHIDPKGKKADIDIMDDNDPHGCPEHSTYSEQYDQCFCDNGYYMFNQQCQPTHITCEEQGGYWCSNGEYSTCEKDEAACYALCPEDKKCNGTCCAGGNVCRNGQCCNDELGECCNANESIGYDRYNHGTYTWSNDCVPLNAVCGHFSSISTYDCVLGGKNYKKMDIGGLDKVITEKPICIVFDEVGNCMALGVLSTEPVCYATDSNGHCRNVIASCPDGQTPYCKLWKGTTFGFSHCFAGPGRQCCSGQVTYGEGENLDTCEE